MKCGRGCAALVLVAATACSGEPPGPDLAGRDLSWGYHADANWRGADLRGADLTGAVLWGADLTGARLDGAVLDGTNLTAADLAQARLTAEQLDQAVWEPASPPRVDSALDAVVRRRRASADGAGAVSIPPRSKRMAKVAEELRRLGVQLGVQTWFRPPQVPADPEVRRFLLRLRGATRVVLHRLRAAGAKVELQEHVGATTQAEWDTVRLTIGDRHRELHLTEDLASVELARAAGDKLVPRLLAFDAEETIALQIRALAAPVPACFLAGGAPVEPPEGGSFRQTLAQRGFETQEIDLSAGEAVPERAVLLLLRPSRPLDKTVASAVREHLRRGGGVLLTFVSSAGEDVLASLSELLRPYGIGFGAKQLFNGVRDPMSGELTFGSARARILILRGGFSRAHLVTRPFGLNEEALLEIDDARALVLADDRGSPELLLQTGPHAWQGVIEGEPEQDRLGTHPVGALVETAEDGRLAVVSGVLLARRSMNVGNSNRELGVRLVEWLAYRWRFGGR